MSKKDILEMKDYVVEAYSYLFNCDMKKSESIVESSSFMKTLFENPSYVMHYDDEYWAKKINIEISKYDN